MTRVATVQGLRCEHAALSGCESMRQGEPSRGEFAEMGILDGARGRLEDRGVMWKR
jgi:hypothetical protein